MQAFSSVLCALTVLQIFIPAGHSQQDFTTAQIPDFRQGVFYPARSSNAAEAEVRTCRAITDRIDRNSARFNNELVTNTNTRIIFSTADSRLMSSRMQSRLDDLAEEYFKKFSRRMTVLKAWTPYPDRDLSGDQESLHYEGRTVRVRLPRTGDYDDFLELAVGEAAFDWVYYAASNYVRLSVIPSNCVRNVDCVFLLDRSGSVGRTNHDTALQFIGNIVSFFSIGLDATRLGIAAYSSSSSIQFDLNDHTTVARLQRAVASVQYTGGSTNTPAALDHARFLLNPRNNRGARQNSLGIPKIAILITDGRSNRGNLRVASSALRNSGVQVYTVGIGNIDQNELRDIASDPDDEHVFILSSYRDAAGFVDFLSVTTCDTPAIIDPGDNTTTTNPDGGIKYFQTECSAFSDKILVELIDINGISFLYCSALETNPGPLTPSTVANETMGITRRTGIVRLPQQRKVVYIGVQGQGMSDSFTLIVWDQLFDPADVFINVVEGALAGAIIYEVRNNLTAAAQGNNYEYSLIQGNEDGIFAINPNNGRVFIPASGSPGVNFNTRRTHNLTVQAVNTIEDCQRARIRINIRVISNRISFDNLPLQQVLESTLPGTGVVRVVASGGAGEINYSIRLGNTNNAFTINPTSGLVTVNGPLDFENLNSYTLRVRAVSVGTTVSGNMDLEIRIVDINEPHMFTTSCARTTAGCSYSIDENEPSTILGTVVATDPDSSTSPNGTLTYSIDNPDVPFSVNAQGAIRTARGLDRELRDSYSFVLVVRDGCGGGCSVAIETNIRVTVGDVNDNAPVFVLNRAVVSVPEDTAANSIVAQYIATDADLGENARIVYSHAAPNNFPFSFNANAFLSLTGSLDFEDQSAQSFMITVTASNPGSTSLSTTTDTEIRVLNVNDNAPMFIGAPYSGDVEENSPANTDVLTVEATDADLGVHGQVRYAIVAGNFNNSFGIVTETGEIVVRNNIDRERIPSFTLVVEVNDLGTPQRKRARTTVIVVVTDVNDNAPIFQPDSYAVQVREDLPEGSNVVLVLASDADEPNMPNSMIGFSIASGNGGNQFRIGAVSGQIDLNSALDFETGPRSYTLTILARDMGNPVMSGMATVTITVINVNENPPTLTGDQEVDVSEAAPVDTVVAVFQAFDPDQMAVTFSIASGSSTAIFEIGESDGRIVLMGLLDYETATRHTLTIEASDGQQSTRAQLTVNVLDENEFAPEFSGPFEFTITEERPALVSDVGRVMATDGDRDAVVSYSFVQQDRTTNLFSLDPQTGQITTRGRLDREALTQTFTPQLSRATVQISAQDNGNPSMRTVRGFTVTLMDINDNAPIFSDVSYSSMLMENLPPNQLVFPVTATDADLGINAELSYSFTLTNNRGNTNPFTIDADTGEITTTAPLDCEQQPFYLFSITVVDMGIPTLSATVSGNLSIIDENDNMPVFDFPVYRRTFSEDTRDSVLLQVGATDADKGRNGEIEYSIIMNTDFSQNLESSEVVTVFQIDSNTGQIRNVNQFDFESATQINITVFAHDGGIPRLSDTTLVVLDITNVDERAPIFTPSTCTVTISEDIQVGGFVTQCEARDLDSTAAEGQAPIMYSFTSSSQFFTIDSTTAEISTIAPLDRETSGGHTLRILATDLAGRSALGRLVVRVSDVNDNAPQFSGVPYSFRFSNSAVAAMQQQLLTVSALDGDDGANGTFSLSIGDVNKVTGTETRVEVVATDSGSPQMSSSTFVSVTFEQTCQLQQYTIGAQSGQLAASLLCSVEVTPSSFPLVLGGSGTITCRIVSNTEVSYQWLHNSTIITAPVVVMGGNGVEIPFTISNAQFSDAGEYACKVSSTAGSLQTTDAATAIIQVRPTITTPPKDMAVAVGSKETFTCAAVGLPPPTTQWFFGSEKVGEGRDLMVAEVDSDDAGTYTCTVSNTAGTVSSSAELTVFDSFNVVELRVEGIDSPSIDGSCQQFDPTALESAIADLTNQRVEVTSVKGGEGELCELSPCSPSPCQNGGECALNEDVIGGYECACRPGFTGVNCTLDESECDQDPCGVDGLCENTLGSFDCVCNPGFTGRRCQLRDVCSQTPPLCAAGESCVEETFTTLGYECVVPDPDASLIVGGSGLNTGELNDLVQLFIETEALQNSRRRKRQTSLLTTICEPRFIVVNTTSDQALLIWLCPGVEVEPSAEAQQRLCEYLFLYSVISRCKLPLGVFMTPPIIPPLPSVNIEVSVIVVDRSTNKPIDALDSVKILEENGVLSETAGFKVSAITAQEMEPRPQEGANSGAVAGGVVAGILIVFIVLAVVGAIAGFKVHGYRRQQERKQTHALQMVTIEGGKGSSIPNSTSQGSMENLLSADGSPVTPKRPPKPASPTPKVDLEESIYQNVTKSEMEKEIVASTAMMLESSSADNDYDILPSKKS